MPPRNTLKQRLPQGADGAQLTQTVTDVVRSVEGLNMEPTTEEAPVPDWIVSASGDSWSRAARRKRQKAMQIEGDTPPDTRMTCRIRVNADCLTFDWLKGRERTLFESFASHIERKVASAMKPSM